MPEKLPWPRLATTRRAAWREASTSTSDGWPSITWAWTARPGWAARRRSTTGSSIALASAAGSKSLGSGITLPQLVGYSHAVTRSRRPPVRTAWAAAHSTAPSAASEPS